MIVKRISNTELYHHGIKGQKWGVRRFQNPDGTLTDAGRKKYVKSVNKLIKNNKNDYKHEKRLSDKYGINRDHQGISKVNKQFDKDRGLMGEASKLTSEQWDKEFKDFDSLLEKAKVKYKADDLGFSYAQMYCLNRGVNPIDYSKKVSKAQDAYRKNMEKEVGRILGDVGNEPLSDSKHWAKSVNEYVADMKIRENIVGDYFDSDMLSNVDYEEDKKIFKQIINARNKNK